MTTSKILAVNFTYALPDGLWVFRADGTRSWHPHSELIATLGQLECSRLYGVAYAGGMTGMWYDAATGLNCYVDGVAVNPAIAP